MKFRWKLLMLMLMQVIRENGFDPAKAIAIAALDAVEEYRDRGEQAGDITVMAIKVTA